VNPPDEPTAERSTEPRAAGPADAAFPVRAAEAPALPGGSATDLALVAACSRGDETAWAAFTDRFSPLFAHVADRTAAQWRLSLGTADRDDVVAETLLACLRNDAAALRGFAGKSTLATYLAVIARRVTVRMLAARAETRRVATADTVDVPADPRLPQRPSDQIADRDEVERLLTRLDAAEARLVRLHHLEGCSYGEISRLTGMPLGSIGPALSRAKVKMRGGTITAAAEGR
jgi:RNA polymerase sigma-70 factor (ECF subfamily)